MARKGTPANGRDRLEEAMATLIQNQAALLSRVAETDRAHVEYERHHVEYERRQLEFQREAAERFARIEAQMAEIIRVLSEHGRLLNEHGRLLERLPEAVRDKIGFKGRRPDRVPGSGGPRVPTRDGGFRKPSRHSSTSEMA